MAAYALHEFEMPELEDELEGAAPLWRGVYPSGEGEAETEAFFESLAEYAVGGGGRGGGLGRVAAAAATAARASGVPLATMAMNLDGTRVIEGELESAMGPATGMSPLALMEHYGHAAAEAESEAEAEAFLFPLVPLAAKLLAPRIGRLVMRRVGPRLIRGVLRSGRVLRGSPRTRPLVRVMPGVTRRAMADIARTSQGGRPVTPQLASAALARHTHTVLSDPQQSVSAYRRSRRLDRRYHVTVREAR